MQMSLSAYEQVLRDLRKQRTEIDAAIATVERLRTTQQRPKPEAVAAPSSADGEFAGMTIADAAVAVLARSGRALGVAQILAAITAGGVVMKSKDNANTLGSILARRMRDVGDIKRVERGTWSVATKQFELSGA